MDYQFNIDNPLTHPDIYPLILNYTRGFKAIRPFFCVNKFFNKCMSSSYNIRKVNDPPCIICHERSDYIFSEFRTIIRPTFK